MPVLKFHPSTKQEVLALFLGSLSRLGFRHITRLDQGFPDCQAIRKSDGREVAIHFEYCSANFVLHKHDPSQCDYIVCWIDDAPRPLPLPPKPRVIELSKNKLFQTLPENPAAAKANNQVTWDIMELCYLDKSGLSGAEFRKALNKFHVDHRVAEARCLMGRMISGQGQPGVKKGRLALKEFPVLKADRWAVVKDKKLMLQSDALLRKLGFPGLPVQS